MAARRWQISECSFSAITVFSRHRHSPSRPPEVAVIGFQCARTFFCRVSQTKNARIDAQFTGDERRRNQSAHRVEKRKIESIERLRDQYGTFVESLSAIEGRGRNNKRLRSAKTRRRRGSEQEERRERGMGMTEVSLLSNGLTSRF